MVLWESFFVRRMGLGSGGRGIDPGSLGDGSGGRRAIDESFGVGGEGRLQDGLASLADLIRLTVVEHGWGEQTDAGVVMLVVELNRLRSHGFGRMEWWSDVFRRALWSLFSEPLPCCRGGLATLF